MSKVTEKVSIRIGGLEFVTWQGDSCWYCLIVCGSYRSKVYSHFNGIHDAESCARETLDDWFKDAGIELVMTKQLFLTLAEELQ